MRSYILTLSAFAALCFLVPNAFPTENETKRAAAISILELYLDATLNRDFDRASELLLEFQRYEPRAKHIARLTYRRNRELFDAHSISSHELYGVETKKGPLRNDIVILEGKLVASNTVQSDYKAEIVRYHKRWLIRSIELE